jgi:hypothetical protein
VSAVVLQLIGWLGSALLVFSVLQSRFMRFRVLNSIASAVLVVYNAIIAVWPMAAVNLALLVINIWFIVTLVGKKKAARAFTWVEADTRLRDWFFDRYGSDLARFHPEADARADLAAVLFHDAAAIGLVLAQRQGDDAVLLADYVVPDYRDFAPGSFVYSPAGPLAGWGVKRVQARQPRPAVAKYLLAMGFQPGANHSLSKRVAPPSPKEETT